MSLTARPCGMCGDSIFADDPHSCVENGKSVTNVSHFPSEPHWAILDVGEFPETASLSYRAYQTQQAWIDEITQLTQREAKFVAFQASSPAKVTPKFTVEIKPAITPLPTEPQRPSW